MFRDITREEIKEVGERSLVDSKSFLLHDWLAEPCSIRLEILQGLLLYFLKIPSLVLYYVPVVFFISIFMF